MPKGNRPFEVSRKTIVEEEYNFKPEAMSIIKDYFEEKVNSNDAAKALSISKNVLSTAAIAYIKMRVKNGTLSL